jgi:hypothetical protein
VALLVATVIQYLVAPLTLDQLKVGVRDTPVAPFDGAESVGAARQASGFGLFVSFVLLLKNLTVIE